MEPAKIERINCLARKSRESGLTDAEKAEQKALRDEYIAEYRANLRQILDHTSVQYDDGTKVKLQRKKEDEGPADLFGGVITTHTVAETEKVGCRLAEYLGSHKDAPRFVAMYGDLGVGKTAFTRGFAGAVVPHASVKSPTYTIVNEYRQEGCTPVFHFDMYRINSEDDLTSIGFDDYLAGPGYYLVEWSEQIPFAIPDHYIKVTIQKDVNNPDIRAISLSVI